MVDKGAFRSIKCSLLANKRPVAGAVTSVALFTHVVDHIFIQVLDGSLLQDSLHVETNKEME